MNTLFPTLDIDPIDEGAMPPPHGPFASVAIEDSLDKLLDYSVPARLLPLLKVGQRVRAPLGRGNRPAHGYVISIQDETTYPRIKPLMGIDDERVLLSPAMMR